MPFKAILWDFGDTLVDERWCQAPLDGYPDWPRIYRDTMEDSDLARDWNTGVLDAVGLSEGLAKRVGAPAEMIHDHLRACCANVNFFEGVLNFAKQFKLPQAIVTVNPDAFSDWVVPNYRLDRLFPVIVTSWQEQTLSKAEICDVAIERLGGGIERHEALLVDNRSDCCEEWSDLGGRSYLFTDEKTFLTDAVALLA